MTRAQSLGSEEEGPEVRKQTQRGIGKKARLANPGSRVTWRLKEACGMWGRVLLMAVPRMNQPCLQPGSDCGLQAGWLGGLQEEARAHTHLP